MAISRARKEELVAQYRELLEASDGFTIVETQGITVGKIQEMRKKIYEAGGQYMVTKNTLLTKALEQIGYTIPEDLLKGPTAVVFGKENFPGVAKAVLDFIKSDDLIAERMKVTGGLMGTSEVLKPEDVKSVSELPTLPELQAQIIGLIIQPAQNIVNILQSAESGVVNVLQAWLDKEDSGDEGEGEAA